MQPLAVHLILVASAVGQLPAQVDVASVERAALANRQAVRTAFLSVRCNYKSYSKPTDDRRSEATIWMDGDRLRTDHVDHYPGLGEAAGKRYIECFNCERPGHQVSYPELPHVAGRIEPMISGKPRKAAATIDPRLFGYVPMDYSTLGHFRLDSYIGRTDRSDPLLTREMLDGVECRVVRYTLVQGKVRVTTWFDSKRGYIPLRMESTEGNIDHEFRMSVSVVPQSVGNGLWYPKSVRFTLHQASKLETDETIEMTEVRINQPIPDETFALKGMGIADGTHFSIVGTKEESWVWRNGQLVTGASEDAKRVKEHGIPNPEPVPLLPSARPRYWLYGVGAGLAVGGALLVWRALRRRSA